MMHHDHKRRRVVREVHGDGQQIAPIRKERLRFVREEEVLVIGIQIRREADDTEWFAHRERQVLQIHAVIIDDQVPLSWGEQQLQSGPIGDLLQANHVRGQKRNHLTQLAESIPLVEHLGAEELDVIGGHADLCAPDPRGKVQEGREPQHIGSRELPMPAHRTSLLCRPAGIIPSFDAATGFCPGRGKSDAVRRPSHEIKSYPSTHQRENDQGATALMVKANHRSEWLPHRQTPTTCRY